MAHKPKIDQNFAPSKFTLGAISLQALGPFHRRQ